MNTVRFEFFEVPAPNSNGLCSDNQCPCNETVIPVGEGYLYIPQSCCDFRRDCRKWSEVATKVARMERTTNRMLMFDQGITGPVLVCKQGVERRGLDLAVAAADAKHWWATGEVPLRPTPQQNKPKASSALSFDVCQPPPASQYKGEPSGFTPASQPKPTSNDFKIETCAHCGRHGATFQSFLNTKPPGLQVMDGADYMHYCWKCRAWICGACAYPEWTRARGSTDSNSYLHFLVNKAAQQYGRIPPDFWAYQQRPFCPQCHKEMRRDGHAPGGRCFIATAAYSSDDAAVVQTLCVFRDTLLRTNLCGRVFIRCYEYVSPPLANWIAPHPILRWLVRTILIEPIASVVENLTKTED